MLYKKISKDVEDFGKFREIHNLLKANDADLNRIKNIFNGDVSFLATWRIRGEQWYSTSEEGIIKVNSKKIQLYCYKYDDNWWMVSRVGVGSLYLCDDFDGLKELAKDFDINRSDLQVSERLLFENEKFYQEIMTSEYYSFGSHLFITNDRYDKIKNLLSDRYDIYRSDRIARKNLDTQGCDNFIYIISQRLKVEIYESNDEWYKVYFFYEKKNKLKLGGHKTIYYKCDQFDGLLKLLEDKNIIK